MPRAATVVDVAEAAGVSRQTVSNVLNTPDIVAPATRERVEQAIAVLGYRPHASARRLRTRQSSTLGVRLDPVVDGISGAVLDRFLHALVESADERGMRILLFTAKDPDDEIRQAARLSEGSDVDGFVLTSTFHDDPRTTWLVAQGIPFVTFGRPWGMPAMDEAPFPWVDVDGAAGLYEATRHLLGRGHRRVGFLGWPPQSGQGDERRRGWHEAMRGAGFRDTELDALTMASPDDVSAATAVVRDALARGRAFDAVVCASDSLALGARIATSNAVPVIGYDNTPVAAALGLSSIEQPMVEVARATLELLMGQGRSVLPDARGHRLLAPTPVWRD
jgi:DNA-binding LacI/PurR family transcriptional regulator